MSNTLKFGAGKWAAKEGSVLAYNDENNNFKPLPFTFTRASTATRVNESGLIESVASGVPRIDFLNNADGHLLLEPSRTNSIPYSNDFSNAAWNKVATAVTSASAISPDGTNNACKFQGDGSGTTVRVYEGQDLTADTTHFLSVFAKKGTNNYIRLLFSGFDGSSSGGYNLDAGTAVGNNASIFDYGNGWYKCVLFANITSPDVSGTVNIYVSKSDTFTPFDDTTEASNAYVYVYGAQVEAGSYATSYIPTSGSSVTRAAERNTQTNVSQLFSSSGVLYAEIELGDSTTNASSTQLRFALSADNSINNSVFFGIENGDDLRTYVRASSVTSTDALTNGVFPSSGIYKVAMRYDLNNTKVFVNGQQKYSDISSTPPSNLNSIQTGGTGAGASDVGTSVLVRDLKLYNTALSDAELIALTS